MVSGKKDAGKSTLFELLKSEEILGNMSDTFHDKLLLASKAPREIEAEHSMFERGVRFATSSEFSEEGKLDNVKLKRHTGGDTISYRPLRQNPRKYINTSKLWLFFNTAPSMDILDDAMMMRMMFFPFENKFELSTENKLKVDNVKNDSDAVIHWLLKCVDEYVNDPLKISKTEGVEKTERMMLVQKNILDDNDPIRDFAEGLEPLYENVEEFIEKFDEIQKMKVKERAEYCVTAKDLLKSYNSTLMSRDEHVILSKFSRHISKCLPINIKVKDFGLDKFRVGGGVRL